MSNEDKTGGYFWGTGRRKCAQASVRLRPGSGHIVVNDRKFEDFFKDENQRGAVTSVLKFTKLNTAFDVFVSVNGGGITGQAEAIRMGIARALLLYDRTLEKGLRDEGYLTRDSRMVERKKYGQAGARRRFQFSKR
ncbi:MAG TPA: 30S ribosomal protein S9 [Planctomycetota bacterium]|nr:30S ribosomal protein S9 [Planctomycetota bacterium]